jgi:hypothetical protein
MHVQRTVRTLDAETVRLQRLQMAPGAMIATSDPEAASGPPSSPNAAAADDRDAHGGHVIILSTLRFL